MECAMTYKHSLHTSFLTVPKGVKCDMKKDRPEHIVCGEDGITYPNECAMHHGKTGVPVSLAYRGPCKLACSPTDKSSAKVIH